MYNTTSLERLNQIEQERNTTYADQRFQQWMRQLNVSRLWTDRQPILNAREAMTDWNITKLNTHKIHIV